MFRDGIKKNLEGNTVIYSFLSCLFVCFRITCTDTNRLSLCTARDKVGVFCFICSVPHIFSPPTPWLAFIHAHTQMYLHTIRFQRISPSLGECDQWLGWKVYIFSLTSHFHQSYNHRWVFLGRVLNHLTLSIQNTEIPLVKAVLWRVGVYHVVTNYLLPARFSSIFRSGEAI